MGGISRHACNEEWDPEGGQSLRVKLLVIGMIEVEGTLVWTGYVEMCMVETSPGYSSIK